MEGRKNYTFTKGTIFEAIYDIIELQNGSTIISDAIHGKLLYRITMYGFQWDVLYSVNETTPNKCLVVIRVEGERRDKGKEIRRQFALLDSMLNGGAQVELSD